MFKSTKYRILLRSALLLLLLSTVVSNTYAYAQEKRVTLNESNTPLKEIFSEISRQTQMYFFADASLLDQEHRYTINVKNGTLDNVLSKLLGSQFNWTFNKNMIRLTQRAIKPIVSSAVLLNRIGGDTLITIKGRIVDEKGNPIPGASVIVAGSKNGTSTSNEGEFILSDVKKNAIIAVSSVAFLTQTIPVQGKTTLQAIVMKPYVSTLDETVIVAYGTTTQRYNTGNVTTIKAADIEKQPVNNPLYALQGRVPGMIITPTSGMAGGSVSVQIRGKNSLNANSEPLYVVDGLPYNNTIPGIAGGPGLDYLSALNFINPADIESIDVLKDADATAIYGSRGANGVIVITTKKGKTGASKVDVSFRNGWMNVNKKLNLLNTRQYIAMRKEALTNDGSIDLLNNPDYESVYPDLMVWDQNRYTDWQKKLIGGTGHYTDLQGAVSGGQANVQYYIGGNYHRETTVFPGDNSDQKGSVHFNITNTSSNQRFKAIFTGSYMSNTSTLPGTDFTKFATHLAPNAPLPYNQNGSLNWEPNNVDGFATWDNPYANLLAKYKSTINNLTSSADISYQLIPKILIKTTLGYSNITGSSIQTNPFTSRDPKLASLIGNLARYSSFATNEIKNLSIEPQILYTDQFGKGKLDFLLGGAYQSNDISTQNISAFGYINDALLNSLGAASTSFSRNSNNQYKYNAAFARVTYNYDNRYILNLNTRRDGSSRFGPGKQFGNFGSLGFAWLFSNERFFEPFTKIISFAKLRASYGTAGNDGISDYRYLQLYQASQTPYRGDIGYESQGLYNPNYAWERTKKIEVGMETGFLDYRILFSASYFRNRSDNQLISYPVPSTAGYGNLITNLPALIQNTGFELVLNSTNVKSNKFNWSSSLNFTTSRNKLVKYPNLSGSAYYQVQIGKPFTDIYVYHFAGLDPVTGLYQFYDDKGKTISNPATSVAPHYGKDMSVNISPRFYGGFSNTFTYSNISLDIFLQFTKQVGLNPFYQFNKPGNFYKDGQIGNQPIEVLDRWQKEGDKAEFQKYTTMFNDAYEYASASNIAYVDASFLRLKNIALSYSLPGAWKERAHLKEFRLFLQSQNVFTITKYKGLDPETQNMNALPPLRIFSFGINISF